jgi:imidazolonepropionase
MSMPFVMNLACINFKAKPSEALVAATLNSAYAIDRSHCAGSIEVGKLGDFAILNASSWEHILY